VETDVTVKHAKEKQKHKGHAVEQLALAKEHNVIVVEIASVKLVNKRSNIVVKD
jgi:hypothetical protein